MSKIVKTDTGKDFGKFLVSFKSSIMKIKDFSKLKKFYLIMWILSAIFLIVTIVLFVVWQTSSLETYGDGKYLTSTAIYQQNVITAITLVTIIFLALAIFSTTIEAYMKKKKNSGGK